MQHEVLPNETGRSLPNNIFIELNSLFWTFAVKS